MMFPVGFFPTGLFPQGYFPETSGNVTPVPYFLPPKITFQVNILPIDPSREIDLINQRLFPSFRHLQATIMVPGIKVVLNDADTFFLTGILAVYVNKAYSNGIIGDLTSQPLITLSIE